MYYILNMIMYIMKTKILGREGELNLDPGEPGKDYMFYESNLRIIPISDMRDTSKVSELANDGMVCVTKNGYAHLRILSEDAYRKMMDRLVFLECVYSTENVLKGLEGKTLDEALSNSRRRNGLPDRRI